MEVSIIHIVYAYPIQSYPPYPNNNADNIIIILIIVETTTTLIIIQFMGTKLQSINKSC